MVDDSIFSIRFEQRLHLILKQRDLGGAMRVLNDDKEHDGGGGGGLAADDTTMLGVFRRRLNTAVVLALQDSGNDEHRVFQGLRQLVIRAGQETVHHLVEPAYLNAGLEKQTFHGAAAGGKSDDGGITECGICLEEFVVGGQVCVMPCPCRGHRFHPGCIVKWLGISSMCPLCRHELPTPGAYISEVNLVFALLQ